MVRQSPCRRSIAHDHGSRPTNVTRCGGAQQTRHATLRNLPYAGWVKSGDLLVRRTHPPIVTQTLFDTVQDVLAGRSKTRQTRPVLNPEFPLRQFIRCAKCDKGLTAGVAKKTFPYSCSPAFFQAAGKSINSRGFVQ